MKSVRQEPFDQPPFTLRLFTPHIDHLHIEWTREGSQHLRLRNIEQKIGQLKSDVEDLGVYGDSAGVL